jgi:hypothetical protein
MQLFSKEGHAHFASHLAQVSGSHSRCAKKHGHLSVLHVMRFLDLAQLQPRQRRLPIIGDLVSPSNCTSHKWGLHTFHATATALLAVRFVEKAVTVRASITRSVVVTWFIPIQAVSVRGSH